MQKNVNKTVNIVVREDLSAIKVITGDWQSLCVIIWYAKIGYKRSIRLHGRHRGF